jgi:dsDNA-specific endonuclease/ATPase MutS2
LRQEKCAREIKERSDLQTEQKLKQEYNDLKILHDIKAKEWEQKMKDSERSLHEIIRNQKQKLNEYAETLKKEVGKTIELQKNNEKNTYDTRKLREKLEESERQPGTTYGIPCHVLCDDTETRLLILYVLFLNKNLKVYLNSLTILNI